LTVPEAFLALIRENAAQLFWNIPDSKPVWPLGAFLQPEMTVNSTCWEADLKGDRP
jgi:hypothetical protein